MDRASLNLYVRMSGSTALAGLFLYGGMALERYEVGAAAATGFIFLAIVLAIASNWAMARLNAKRPAQWATLVVLGVIPAATFLGQFSFGNVQGLFGGVLWMTLVAGLATIALAGLILRER